MTFAEAKTMLESAGFDFDNPRCQTCRGKADEVYFNDKTKEVLAVICTPCKTAFETSIRSLGQSFCTTPACPDCKE